MSPAPVFKKGNTAVITGGASGIGLALARKCALEYGMDVVICDVDGGNLREARESILREKEGNGAKGEGKVEIVEMDVGKVEDFEKVKVS